MPGRHRGIWVEPGTGPSGEQILCVLDHAGHRLATAMRPPAIPPERFLAALESFLALADPVSSTMPRVPPDLRRVDRHTFPRLTAL